MRILWLSHLVPYPPKGGVLQRAHYMLREVARYHEVDLVAFNQKSLMAPFFPSLEVGLDEAEKVLGEFCRDTYFLDIPADKTKSGKYLMALKSIFSSDPYTINWLKSKEYAQLVDRLLAENEYDLVHFDTISLLPYFDSIGSIPAVLDHHNIESHMLLRRVENETNALKKWYYGQEGKRLEKFEKEYCPQFALNITCSEVDANRLQEIAVGCRAVEVPNGVDIDFFKADGSEHRPNSLIFVGRLNWYPNTAAVRFIAHQLWPALKAAIPDINIDIIGANPPEDLVALSGEDLDFRVHGFVDDIHSFMNTAAVYLCPITDGGGTKLKILDALSMKKAIVAHPIACEGIRVSNGKNVMFAESVDDYVAAIKQLFKDGERRKAMGKEARALIEAEYSYTKIGKQLSELYQRCVESS
ncbi:MAG: glycosyltransferase [Gammaproteobacteria bacterium]|nr:glycosyltransferase [Gammaproteobacteria bacterium]